MYAVGSVNNIHHKGFISVVTQELNQKSGNNAREVILVNKNVVVSRLARHEQACVAIEIIIAFNRTHHIRVYNRVRAAIPLLALGNDHKCDRGVEVKASTCVCELAVARERWISFGA